MPVSGYSCLPLPPVGVGRCKELDSSTGKLLGYIAVQSWEVVLRKGYGGVMVRSMLKFAGYVNCIDKFLGRDILILLCVYMMII